MAMALTQRCVEHTWCGHVPRLMLSGEGVKWLLLRCLHECIMLSLAGSVRSLAHGVDYALTALH
jgi:hypothetical protein